MMEQSANQANQLGVNESPRHGPTLSTSTSSFEALEPYDSELSRLATKAFDKTYTYVTHDLNSSIDDYKLLEQINRACIAKYSDMQQISENLATSSVELKEKFENLVCSLRTHHCCWHKIDVHCCCFIHDRHHIWSKLTISSRLSTNWKPALINWMHTANNWSRNSTIC